MKYLTLLAALFVTPPSRADVLFSVEHTISIDALKSVQKYLTFAKERDAEMMTYPAIFPISFEDGTRTPLTLSCLPMQPQMNGEGCTIVVSTGKASLGEVSVLFRKELSETLLSKAVARLESIIQSDPNQVEDWDHKQVGNPFNSASDGTHIYCASEGTQPNKVWSCRLSMAESLKNSPNVGAEIRH